MTDVANPIVTVNKVKELNGHNDGQEYQEVMHQALNMMQQAIGGSRANRANVIYIPIGQLVIDKRSTMGDNAVDSAMRRDLLVAMGWIIKYLQDEGDTGLTIHDRIDRLMYQASSEMCGKNKTHMAELLGMKRSTVQMALKRFKLSLDFNNNLENHEAKG